MSKTPVELAFERHVELVAKKDRAGFIANFHEDAVVEDPVGPTPLDPTGMSPRTWSRRWSQLARAAGLDPREALVLGLSGGADSVFLLNFLFVPASDMIPEPFECGADPTPDALTCDMSACP